jgi:hypothetical protein
MTALLVIVCSGYPRRFADTDYGMDPAIYLKRQHHSLSRLRYDCAVVLVNHGGCKAYNDYLDTLRDTYEVLDKPNVGMSLGAFAAAWRKFPDFDYYILSEDDYMFVMDYFDRELIALMKTVPNCGYMCQVVDWSVHAGGAFPGAQDGIATRELMEAIGIFPFENEPSQHGFGERAQFGFGMAIKEAGYVLADTGVRFKAPFFCRKGLTMHYAEAPEMIKVPSQIYERWVGRDDSGPGDDRHCGKGSGTPDSPE